MKLPYSVAGLKQALGIAGYCALVGLIFWKGNTLFGPDQSYVGPVMVLMLFSTSALICGLLVFYQPYLLFFKGKKEQAAALVLSTTLWLFTFFVSILLTAIIF